MPSSRSHCRAPEREGEVQQLDALWQIAQRWGCRPKDTSGRAPERLRRTPGLFLQRGLSRSEPPDRDHRFSVGSLIRSVPANCRQPLGAIHKEVCGAKLHHQHLRHRELFSRGGFPSSQPSCQDQQIKVGNFIRSVPANCRLPLGTLQKGVCGAKLHYRHWSHQELFSGGSLPRPQPELIGSEQVTSFAACRRIAGNRSAPSARKLEIAASRPRASASVQSR